MTELNPLIPLAVKPLEIGNAVLEGRQIAQNRQLTDQKIAESEARTERLGAITAAESQKARDKRRAMETIPKLSVIERLYKTKGADAAIKYAESNRDQIKNRIAKGEDVDSVETNEILDSLYAARSGDDSALSETFTNGRMAAQMLGIELPGYSGEAAKTSASTKIFSNGAAIMANNQGGLDVIDEFGQVVTDPKRRAQVLQSANEFESSLQGDRAAQREGGTAKIKMATDLIGKIPVFEQQLASYDRAIAALNEGAPTGPIRKQLAPFTDAGVKLLNEQKKLGLSTLQMVSFGALNEAELNLVLEEAIPTNLTGPALSAYLEARKVATRKAMDYTITAATFLADPDNDLQDWAEYQGSLSRSTEAVAKESQEPEMVYNPANGEFE